MSAEEITEKFQILDKMARKSDRWWFLALLMIGMSYVGWERYDTRGELTKRDERISAIERQYIDHLTSANISLTQALAENTKVIEANNRLLERVEARTR